MKKKQPSKTKPIQREQRCKVCRHPKLVEIDKALLTGDSVRHIASHYTFSYGAVQRHKRRHLRKVVKEALEASKSRLRIMTAQEVWETTSALCLYDPLEWANQFGALKDLKDIPWEHRLAIREITRRDLYDQAQGEQRSIIGEVRKYKGESRLQSLRLLAQLHNLIQHEAPTTNNTQINFIMGKSDAELDYFIKHLEWPSNPIPPAEGRIGDGAPSANMEGSKQLVPAVPAVLVDDPHKNS